jgi:hypothetical protein
MRSSGVRSVAGSIAGITVATTPQRSARIAGGPSLAPRARLRVKKTTGPALENWGRWGAIYLGSVARSASSGPAQGAIASSCQWISLIARIFGVKN